MSEFSLSRYQPTPQSFRSCLQDLNNTYGAYARPDFAHRDATQLFLHARTGERLVVAQSQEGIQPKSNFFQELSLSVLGGTNFDFRAAQIDFNFNQYGDGQLRKRTVTDTVDELERTLNGVEREDTYAAGAVCLDYIVRSCGKLQAEEEQGRNNQPATPEEIAEALGYLSGAAVLDVTSASRPFPIVATLIA